MTPLTNSQVPSPINMETLGVARGWILLCKEIPCKEYQAYSNNIGWWSRRILTFEPPKNVIVSSVHKKIIHMFRFIVKH